MIRRLAVLAVLVTLAGAACGELLSSDESGGRPAAPSGADASAVLDATYVDAPLDPSVDAGTDGGAPAVPRERRVVFVTRAVRPGGLGGLTTADAVCNAEAADAGLGGTFVAWLSVTNGLQKTDAIDRLSSPDGGWSLVDGGVVFADRARITGQAGGTPEVGITTDAWGASVGLGEGAWTATFEDGRGSTHPDCVAWTSDGGVGVVGTIGATDKTWTSGTSVACLGSNRLICFEK